jgi:hypothetical protein
MAGIGGSLFLVVALGLWHVFRCQGLKTANSRRYPKDRGKVKPSLDDFNDGFATMFSGLGGHEQDRLHPKKS